VCTKVVPVTIQKLLEWFTRSILQFLLVCKWDLRLKLRNEALFFWLCFWLSFEDEYQVTWISQSVSFSTYSITTMYYNETKGNGGVVVFLLLGFFQKAKTLKMGFPWNEWMMEGISFKGFCQMLPALFWPFGTDLIRGKHMLWMCYNLVPSVVVQFFLFKK
jgi:hypothetical protein